MHIVSTPSNTPPAPPAAQITSRVATVPREATARSRKNDTEDDIRYVRGSFTGHLQLLTVTVWLDLLYWRYSVQQGMDPPAVLKVKVAAQSCHSALSVRCTPLLCAAWAGNPFFPRGALPRTPLGHLPQTLAGALPQTPPGYRPGPMGGLLVHQEPYLYFQLHQEPYLYFQPAAPTIFVFSGSDVKLICICYQGVPRSLRAYVSPASPNTPEGLP